MSGPQSFYLKTDDDVFASTTATASPWDAALQHGGPPSALLARAVERCSPRPDMLVAKITIDFLGALPQGRLTTRASVIRPGKRIELVEATLSANDRPLATARAWRIRTSSSPTSLTDARMPVPLPPPQPQRYLTGVDPEWGYGRAIEWRSVDGSFESLGPAQVWARPLLPLVLGEEPTGLQRTLLVTDSINGLSAELDLREWLFVPTSLTVTMDRHLETDWLLMDARTTIGSNGIGTTNAQLCDEGGPFGVATQPLVIERRDAPT
jgi:hypothetical protein